MRNSERPWFNSDLRKNNRKQNRIRKTATNIRNSRILIYIQETEKTMLIVNIKDSSKMENIILKNTSNPKSNGKITKTLIKSNK